MRIAAVVAVIVAVLGGQSSVVLAADPVETKLTIENNRFSPDELKKDKTPEEFESKELKIEKVIPPGQTVKVRVRALKPGTYNFVGDYHQATAKGRIIAE